MPDIAHRHGNVIPVVIAAAILLLLASCSSGATTISPAAGTPTKGAQGTATASATIIETPTAAPITPSLEAPAADTPESPTTPLWRYVNSGWVSPREFGPAGAIAEQLRAYVITNQIELDAFNDTFFLRRSMGNVVSLGRVDFPNSILIAAYYLWRPLRGDPLTVEGFSIEGLQATVQLELEESPQGREYPYLLAPMTMVAMERSLFPTGQPIDFVFQLNGEPLATVVATVD